ncbi:MAG: hypothetical protein MJ093_02950 [Saccharofermentans sp.]|nr:hypothetical protein [Saccharofermentans sp.]
MKKFINVITWVFGFPFKLYFLSKKKGNNGCLTKLLMVPVAILYVLWMFVFTAFCAGVMDSGKKANEDPNVNETLIVESTVITDVNEETQEVLVEETENVPETTETSVMESSSVNTTVASTEQTVNVENETSPSIEEVTATSTEAETMQTEDTVATIVETVAVDPVVVPIEPVATTIADTSSERHEYIQNANNNKIHRTSCSFGPQEQNRITVYLTDEELANSDRCQRCFK